MTHDLIVQLAWMWSALPDAWSLTLLHGELILNGDGSFVTGVDLSRQLYG